MQCKAAAASSTLGDALYTPGEFIRLVPFVYSDEQSYVLEFGRNALSFWSAGQRLTGAGGAPLQLATPYTDTELARLSWVQSGDVLLLTHPGYPPQELRRLAHTTWTLAPISMAARQPYFPARRPGLLTPLPDAARHESPLGWVYAVTTVGEDADGTRWESAPYRVTETVTRNESGGNVFYTYAPAPTDLAASKEGPLTVTWPTEASAWPPPSFRVVGWRVYRGRGEMLGLIGETQADFLRDVGEAPDYAQPPPRGRNPFEVRGPAGAGEVGPLLRTEYPAVCAYYNERLCFARTNERPSTFWGSRPGDYFNFDDHVPSIDDESIEYTMAARTREEVRWLVALNELVLGTSGSVWAASAAGGGPLEATGTASLRVQSSEGCAWVPPVVVGSAILFARQKGGGLRELLYEEGRQGYVTSPIDIYAPHLTQGLRELAWEEDSRLWCLNAWGKLSCLTYVRQQEVFAWTAHDTAGHVVSICTVPEGGRDALYACVRRFPDGHSQRHFIERLAPHTADATHGVFLDAVRVFPWQDFATEVSVPHLAGATVTVVADGEVFAGLTVPQSGVLPVPSPGGAEYIRVGLPYTAEMELLDLPSGKTETATKQKAVASVQFELLDSRGAWVGETLEDTSGFTPVDVRAVETGFGALPLSSGRTPEVHVSGTWGTGGRAAIQQREPMPLTVVAAVRHVVLGG